MEPTNVKVITRGDLALPVQVRAQLHGNFGLVHILCCAQNIQKSVQVII